MSTDKKKKTVGEKRQDAALVNAIVLEAQHQPNVLQEIRAAIGKKEKQIQELRRMEEDLSRKSSLMVEDCLRTLEILK